MPLKVLFLENQLQASEFDLVAETFCRDDCCPHLLRLDLSGTPTITESQHQLRCNSPVENQATGEGLFRFCKFFTSAAATRLQALDLSRTFVIEGYKD